MDEGAYCKEEVFDVMLGRIRLNPAKAWVTSSPNGKQNWLYRTFRPDNPYGYSLYRGSTRDNHHLPKDYVDTLTGKYSTAHALQEIEGEFTDLEGARVKREWLRYADAAPAGLPIYVGVDLAISQREEADYTAIVVTAHDPDGTIYVIDAVRARATFHETMGLIKSVAAKHQPNMIAVENVGYQQSVIQELVRTTTLPVSPINVTKDKISRFFPVEGKIEHGHVVLLRTLDTAFESELLSFPQGEHDDYVDAFVHSVNAAQNQVSITWL
jgi:predicted phage terminase large subunit-like protein